MMARKKIKVNAKPGDQAAQQPQAEAADIADETAADIDAVNIDQAAEADGSIEGANDQIEGDPIDSDTTTTDLEDRLLRVQAEFENYKRRTARQYEDMVRAANSRLLMELLEVVDNFERAFQHADGDVPNDSLKEGMEMIRAQLDRVLDKNQVTAIEAVGKPFDPGLHEAIMQIDSDDHSEGTVALEITKGYLLGDKVLRFSQVAVSKGAPQPNNDKPDNAD